MAEFAVSRAKTEPAIYFSTRAESRADPYWFDPANEDPGPGMVALGKEVERGQSWRKQHSLRLGRLYQDRRVSNVYSSAGGPGGQLDDTATPMRVSWNIVRAACDVAQARVGRNRSRVMFVSVDGDWSLRRKARLRTRFVDGAFRQARFYEEWRKVFTDATVYGIGLLYIDADEKGKLFCERVIPDEVLVDPNEGVNAKPSTLYRRKRMHKRTAIKLLAGDEKDPEYARKVAAIMGASPSQTSLGGERSPLRAEMIDVWFAWRLPVAGEPGRHVIAVEGCTLYDEEWTRPRFPIVAFRWGDALAGWYGLGVAEQLEGTQLEIRKTLYSIQQGHYHGSVFKWLCDVRNKITAQQFTNDPRGTILYWSGGAEGAGPPQPITPSGVAPDLPQWLLQLWQNGFDQVGLPPAGSGAVPTNIKSGEGIRAYTEAVDIRISVPAQRCDQFAVDCAEVFLDVVREQKAVVVEAKVGRTYQRINWKDVAEGDDDFVLQAWPASLLPATPSGRYDRLNEMVQAGWISKEQALAILDVPDLEGIVSLETSSFEVLSRALENMLDEGKAERPEPYQNLQLSLRIAQDAYLKARADGCPEAHLAQVREYIDAIRDLTKTATAEQAQQPPPGASAPGGGAVPAPQPQPAAAPPMQ